MSKKILLMGMLVFAFTCSHSVAIAPTVNNHVIKVEQIQAVTMSIERVEVEQEETKIISRGLPREADGSFKTYMDYRTITNKASSQYKLQQECWTDKNGFRRYEDCYVVALGTYYSEQAGKKFTIEFEDGGVIDVIVGDIKDDKHTDKFNQYIPMNGNIVEFIVDVKKIQDLPKRMGDMSHTDGVNLKGAIIGIYEIGEEE